ncbi:MAG: hypothetical protein RLZ51_1866 [Pseudomonadota bacterium]|jgi:hypothetical protein
MTNEDDTIRRGDALAAVFDAIDKVAHGQDFGPLQLQMAKRRYEKAIAAVPAVTTAPAPQADDLVERARRHLMSFDGVAALRAYEATGSVAPLADHVAALDTPAPTTDDLVKRLDNLWAMLEEEGHYVKANTVTLAKERIEALERERDEAQNERDFFQSEVKLRNRIPATSDAMADMLRRAEAAEAKAREAALDALAAAGQAQEAYEAQLKAEAKVEAVEAERDAAIAALEESGRKRGETLALLDKAVVALRGRMHCHDCTCGECDHIRDVLAEIEGRVVPGLRDAAERTKGMLVERAPAPQGRGNGGGE